VSGALLAGSFPESGHPAVAWFALAPLLLTLTSGSPGRAFTLGFLAGVIYFTGTLYWITRVMAVYGGLQQWVAVLVNGALILFLALFPAMFAVIVRIATAKLGRPAIVAAPLVWVATELGRTYVFTGFPWVLLGYSQATVLPIAQLASVVGVYGVSALVASVSAAVVLALRDGPPLRRFAPALVTLLLIASTAAWGSARVAGAALTRAGTGLRVGIVQGNVDQAEKWNPARAGEILERYLATTREAIAGGARLVVWPEASMPFGFGEHADGSGRIQAIARESGAAILVGSDEIERGAETRYYNSAFLVRADGSVGGTYRKMHLVPFGEYVPLKPVFFFAAPLVEAVSDFKPGREAVLLPVDGHRISTAICYEIVFPDLVRRFVAGGSELLTTITNDAWFGRTSAPHQHFEQAAMRAIENGRYLIRSANTGISGIVDPYGRVLARSALFEPAVIVGDARLLQGRTFYTRTGDLFAYASVATALALLAAPVRRVR
jgi:apolipoprotein N-acyltransferase